MTVHDRQDIWQSLGDVQDCLASLATLERAGRIAQPWSRDEAVRGQSDSIYSQSGNPAVHSSRSKRAIPGETSEPGQNTSPNELVTVPVEAASITGGKNSTGAAKTPDKDTLERVSMDIARCLSCRLASARHTTVPGHGVRKPVAMIIGEAPGPEEDACGLPFTGDDGQLLDKMLASIGLSRTANCFLTNIVKCVPPGSRDPAPDEQSTCRSFLDRQITLLAPRAILCLGRVAAQSLLNSRESIMKLRGKPYQKENLYLVATYHPRALVNDPSLKRAAWEDLKLFKSLIG